MIAPALTLPRPPSTTELVRREKRTAGNVAPFRSFWMGGYECSDQLNAFGVRVDLLTASRHLDLIGQDYRDLALLNIRTVREGIRWSVVEKAPYVYDWEPVRRMMEQGRIQGIQQVWDICHFGFPDDLTPLHPMFARRFAAICRAFAVFFHQQLNPGPLIVTPINEVSFLSWLGGDVRATAPFCVGQGWEVKYRLMKAYIEGVEALRAVDPNVRILTTEPLVSITHNSGASAEERNRARQLHEEQFQVTDILSGKMCPELGGKPDYIDLLGFNFYYNNQWIHPTHERLIWKNAATDPRWVPLKRLLCEAGQRYGCPVVLTETSHPKEDRPLWIEMIGSECAALIAEGISLLGICWYPIVDRPDWDNLNLWHQAGLWDRVESVEGINERKLHEETVAAFKRVQVVMGK